MRVGGEVGVRVGGEVGVRVGGEVGVALGLGKGVASIYSKENIFLSHVPQSLYDILESEERKPMALLSPSLPTATCPQVMLCTYLSA